MGPNERLEQSQWDLFWVPSDVEVLERGDVAAIRCPRPVHFLNMVVKTRVAPARAAALVEEMRAFIGQGCARWMVPDTFDRRPLEAALERNGWERRDRVEARVIRPADYARSPAPDCEVRRVESISALRDACEMTNRAFGQSVERDEAQLAEELAQCADPRGRVHRFVAYRGAEPVAGGALNWFPTLRLALLWGGGTIPEARGRGAYTALLATRIELARTLGAEWVGLYAKDDTSAPIVARHGFTQVGEMHYWGLPTAR